MNEALLWLLYALAGAIAFACVYRRRWPITLAMIVGASVSLAIWLLFVLFAADDAAPAWFEVELGMNAAFSLIFAGLGAAVAHALPLLKNKRS